MKALILALALLAMPASAGLEEIDETNDYWCFGPEYCVVRKKAFMKLMKDSSPDPCFVNVQGMK